MSESLATLTQAELLALALEASRRGDAGHTLVYLKEAASRSDASVQALFMLGSEYAQLGLTAEAKTAMTRAVERGADFPLARFQLGMLHMTSGEVDAAKAAWAPLALLGESHPQAYLSFFHRGMVHLAADEFDQALHALDEGVTRNNDNAPLNTDMRRVIDAIQHLPGRESRKVIAAQPPEKTLAADGEGEPEPSHLFISAYTGGKPH